MPSRDEQDYETRRQQIIDGALQVFASQGFEKATNKDIAKAAGIKSPGLIYHYFKDKTNLLGQVMEERAPALQIIIHGDELIDRPPREVLTLFAGAFIKTLDNRTSVAVFKVILSEAIRKPKMAEVFNRIGPWRGFDFLTRYLQHQMDEGQLCRMEVGAAVRCFIGPLLAFFLTREVFIQADANTLSAETMVETAVEVFLRGMEVRDE